MFYLYPHDSGTFGIDAQYFYGDSILVSPVTEENSTSVEIYLPDDIFYDWNNGFAPVRGNASMVTIPDVNFTTIPLHVRGGSILPLRVESANTTAELRKKGFHIVIAPGVDAQAKGSLYLDDGLSIEQSSTTFINFTYNNGSLSMSGDYSYAANVSIEKITICSVGSTPGGINIPGQPDSTFRYDNSTQVVTIVASIPLTQDSSLQLPGSQANVIAPGTGIEEDGNSGQGKGGSGGRKGPGGDRSASSPRRWPLNNAGLKVWVAAVMLSVLQMIL